MPSNDDSGQAMIIDIHGHYTTAPAELDIFRKSQLAAIESGAPGPARSDLKISDDQIRETIENGQLRILKERSIDMTIFSPKAAGMAHHYGDLSVSLLWSQISNDLIKRVCDLFPANFAPVCQLPQSPGVSPQTCVDELERCVLEMGFVGCNLNPDPTDGWWTDPPLTDPWWFPLYEKMEELDVPAMIHTSMSCNPHFHFTGAHYINGDTSAFMQLVEGDLFSRFPKLRFVIPHGGGAVPFHWGRYRGLAQDMGKPLLADHLLNNVFFDTCVYHQAGIDLLTKVIPVANVLYASEMLGAIRGVDPETGRNYDDTKTFIENTPSLNDAERRQVFETNARRVYPRLDAQLRARGN